VDLLTSALPIHLYKVFSNVVVVGTVVGIYPVFSIIARVPISKFVYARRLKKTLLASILLLVVSHVGYVFSKSVFVFVVFRSLFGVGLCAFFLLLLEAVNAEIEKKEHSRLYGIFSTIFIFPFLFAPAAGVAILRKSDFTVVIAASIVFYLLSAAFVFFIREKNLSKPGFDFGNFKKYFFSENAHFILLFAMIFAFSSSVVFLPILASEKGFENFAFAFTFYGISTIIFRFLAGKIFESLRFETNILIGSVFVFLAILGFGISKNYAVFFLSACLNGVGWAFFESNYIPSLVAGREKKSELISLYSTIFDFGYFLGPVLSGIFVGKFGAKNLYFVLPAVCSAGAVYFFIAHRK